ncbi:MAG: HAAS signaling domain-containing protein [Gaiellaceae bacterium]
MTTENYLRGVGYALRDLPWRQRRELAADLRSHLAELPAGTDLNERLGTPAQYAADLRSAEGLELRRGPLAFVRARRPRNVILVVVALTLIGLAGGAIAWVRSYQPLTPIHFGITPEGAVSLPGLDGASIVVRENRPFRLGVVIENTGPFTVRVLGAGDPALFFPTKLMMSAPLKNFGVHGNFVKGPFTRFHPFEMSPGQARDLFFEAKHPKCAAWAAGSSENVGDFRVRFGFLWRSRTALIRSPPLSVVCPKRSAPAGAGKR